MTNANITLYGAPWCPDCKRSKQFLGEQRISYNWVDIDQDESGQQRVQELNDGKQIIPTIVFDDGDQLNVTEEELEEYTIEDDRSVTRRKRGRPAPGRPAPGQPAPGQPAPGSRKKQKARKKCGPAPRSYPPGPPPPL